MRQKYLANLSGSSYGDIAESLFRATGSLYEEPLNEYRSLKQRRSNVIEKIKMDEEKIADINNHVNELNRMLGRTKMYFISVLAFIIALLLLTVFTRSSLFIIVALISGAGVLYYAYNMRRNTLRDISNSKREALRMGTEIKELKEELSRVESLISNFKLPDIKARIYRVYIPIGLVKFKAPTGSSYSLGISPALRNGISLRFAVVGNPEDVNEAISEVRQQDEYYRDKLIREKTEGAKIIDELRKINMWEEVYKARSPESLLVRSLGRLEGAVKMIKYDEFMLPIIKPSNDNVKFIKKIIESSTDGRPQNVDMEGVGILSASVGKLEDLYKIIETLSNIKGAVIETHYMADSASNYRDLSERIHDLVVQSIPMDSFSSFTESVYCRKCVEGTLEEHVRRVDLKRWIEVNVLGGVSEDPDIVSLPPRLKKDEDIKGLLASINRLLMEKVPLPGVSSEPEGDRSIDEYEKLYGEGIIKYALAISGADSYIKYILGSPFEEPKMACEVCSGGVRVEDLYYISNLALPYIKGYIATIYEFQDSLYKKSEGVRLSVNQSRLSKEQRKSMLSIDETMRNDLIIKIRDVEYNIKNNIKYIELLKELLLSSEISGLLRASTIFNTLGDIQRLNIQEQVIESE